MARPQFETEEELASAFMAHLEQLGWDCYPEVSVNRGGTRADIVARKDPLIWVIEAKLRLGDAVCEQARAWRGWAHLVTVLVPEGPRHPVLNEWLRDRGVGLVRARKGTAFRGEAPRIEFESAVDARLDRSAHRHAKYMRDHLHPDMKRFKPGTNGAFSSPWRRTMEAAVGFVARNPGCNVKQIVAGVQHHYRGDATARACLLQWLERDPRVTLERAGRAVKFFPQTPAGVTRIA